MFTPTDPEIMTEREREKKKTMRRWFAKIVWFSKDESDTADAYQIRVFTSSIHSHQREEGNDDRTGLLRRATGREMRRDWTRGWRATSLGLGKLLP